MKLLLFFIYIFSFAAEAVTAQAFSDKTEIAINEPFTITIRIQSEGESIEELVIPEGIQFNNFYLLNQWTEKQSSTEIINGKLKSSSAILKRYKLQPSKEGVFKIQLFSIKANGKSFNFPPISITVSGKKKAQPQPPQRSQNFPFGGSSPFQFPNSLFDIFEPLRPQAPFDSSSIKVRTSPSKMTVYKSEGLKADWLILQSSGSITFNIENFPSLKGFWKEELKNMKPAQFAGNEIIDKTLYRKTLAKSLWLFPLKTGKLIIDPLKIRLNKNRFFPQMEIRSFPARTITVKPLPVKGLDSSFTGAVGSSFEVTAKIAENSASVNEPLSYKIIVKGYGHPRFMSLPELKFPSSVKVYKPVEKSSFSDEGKGEKEFEILIASKQEGLLKIPSFKLSVFDVKAKRYIAHYTPPFSIPIKKGAFYQEEGEAFFDESGKKKQSGKGFSYEPISAPFWPDFINHKSLKFFWLILFAFLLLGYSALYIKNFISKKESSFSETVAQKNAEIQKLLNEGRSKEALRGMIRLNYSLIYKGRIKNSSADWRKALDSLPPSLNAKYAGQFEILFKSLENLSFSKQSLSPEEALNKAQQLFEAGKKLSKAFLSDL